MIKSLVVLMFIFLAWSFWVVFAFTWFLSVAWLFSLPFFIGIALKFAETEAKDLDVKEDGSER